MKFNGQYRVVDGDDRAEVLAMYSGPDAAYRAAAFGRRGRCEVQRAIETAPGSTEIGAVACWERTYLAGADEQAVERYLAGVEVGVLSEVAR